MPKYYGPVRPTTPSANSPTYPLGMPPVTPVAPPEGYPEAPYPVADGAGDGASKGYKPTLSKTMGSTNVPQPDNKGPRVTAEGDGKNGMAG